MPIDYSRPVLVVNDVASMNDIVAALLRKIGFTRIDGATNGVEALVKMQSEAYGLIISDWQMQPMTGHDLLEAVRSSPKLHETPFIMVTAYAEPQKVISAKRAGVDGYLGIPFTLASLKNKITEILDS
jgi:two-component system, chemotaxis family, chemotaxis protein CheY